MNHIHPTAVIYPNVIIEDDVWIGAYSIIGGPPESLRFFDGRQTKGVIIRNGARIFGMVTIDAGTLQPTLIEKDAAIFQKSHIAHDCVIRYGAIVGGQCSLAGHTVVMNGATVSGKSCTHQWSVVGAYAFLGAMSYLKGHIGVGELWMGNPSRPSGHNLIGLERAGLTIESAQELYGTQFEELIKERKIT